MIDYESLWKNGMGLHRTQFNLLSEHFSLNEVGSVVEFGSGGSTYFFRKMQSAGMKFRLTSFDHNPKFSFKESAHKDLAAGGRFTLNVKDLISCSDEVFERSFAEKRFLRESFSRVRGGEVDNFRIKNAFYDIRPDEIGDGIDFVVLDGPSGNGRSLAWLLLRDKLTFPCYALIDDANHYDFVARARCLLDIDVLVEVQDVRVHPLFSYAFIRINKKV